MNRDELTARLRDESKQQPTLKFYVGKNGVTISGQAPGAPVRWFTDEHEDGPYFYAPEGGFNILYPDAKPIGVFSSDSDVIFWSDAEEAATELLIATGGDSQSRRSSSDEGEKPTMSKITEAQFDRVVATFRKTAGENGKVRYSRWAFWYFGSELATLRLLKAYRYNPEDLARQGHSENLKCHYFVLETPTVDGPSMETPE